MKAIIDGVQIEGSLMEIYQYQEMTEAKKKNKQNNYYYVTFPAGHIPSPSDASDIGKLIKDLNVLQGHKYYQ